MSRRLVIAAFGTLLAMALAGPLFEALDASPRWVVFDRDAGARVELDIGLIVVRRTPWDPRADELPVANSDPRWQLDREWDCVSVDGRDGRRRAVYRDSGVSNFESLVPSADGGALLVAPGHVLLLDANARPLAAQGGFGRLVGALEVRESSD